MKERRSKEKGKKKGEGGINKSSKIAGRCMFSRTTNGSEQLNDYVRLVGKTAMELSISSSRLTLIFQRHVGVDDEDRWEAETTQEKRGAKGEKEEKRDGKSNYTEYETRGAVCNWLRFSFARSPVKPDVSEINLPSAYF